MLPSILAGQLQEGLSDYIETTFPMTNSAFRGSLGRMLKTKDSVFHEPYIAVKLPFRVSEDLPDIFEAIHPQYNPYVHQQKAFERLTGEDGRSTLIATGTGSGKTECFLYPILEYCYHHRGENGIKALIIYPMNALASDQAKRIAEIIYDSPELRGNVTAGMYAGGHESKATRGMSRDKVITDHETMLSSPPDILLTNYKMLDYLLVRPKDAALWEDNNPETLKFIAVDELHTFDGAQGTDLACLLRRLKARLYTPAGYLCCIGTSATMGAKESAESIREYAENVFGEPFEEDAVITEDRLSSSEFFAEFEVKDFTVPTQEQIDKLYNCIKSDDQTEYLTLAATSWFNDTFDTSDIMSGSTRLAVGRRLMEHSFTQNLIELMDGCYSQSSYLCEELKIKYPQLAEIYNSTVALDALFALISHACIGDKEKLRPFLTVQVQVWMRELRRLLARVDDEDITYALSTDLNENQAKQYLPVVNCRDCGETGWVSTINERGNLTLTDLNTFYNLYFKQDKNVIMIFPHNHDDASYKMRPGHLCPSCLQLHAGDVANKYCSACGTETFMILYPTIIETSGSKDNKQYVCPFCGSKRGVAIVGLRSPTAISAGVSQLFSSKFNDDKKVLAFSDNVQDAAHRAGFFNSRTWRFGLRSAIQRFVLTRGDGLSLDDFSKEFVDYWREMLTNEEFVSKFIAPNMTWMRAYEKMQTDGILGNDKEAQKLINDIIKRVKYEIMLEYGLTGKIGRTLEKSGCSVISFSSEIITTAAKAVKERAINELGISHNSEDVVFERMVIGFLQLMRSNGAFNDATFYAYTKNDGATYLLANDVNKWMPGLKSGRNTPRFIYEMTDGAKRLFVFDALSGNSSYVRWIFACIDEFFVGNYVFEDITKMILDELNSAGIITSMPSKATYKIWALDKKQIFISTNVKQLVCDECGNTISSSEENAYVWENAPCTRNKCAGHLHVSTDASLGYYGKLYSNGDMVRVIAREHTGLLERDDREELENVFKCNDIDKKPWDPNVLSCTPTLEMGIDIGDLSTVVLCSIPPAQAQFLQRAGRGGRKDGNALTIAVANARPHDLYFYADPMEMISGRIEPPKIFLKASAVLERQFVAYCMDCWIKRGVSESAIPKHVGTCLSKLNEKSKDVFPFNLLLFVQNNLSGLLRTFIQLFSDNLDDGAISELRTFAQGSKLKESPMHIKIYEAFENLRKQQEALQGSIKQLKILMKDLESKPKDSSYDKDLKDLKNERVALLNVVRNLKNKDVFNFLSDEGLLPNYAFPEAGIILKAVLYRREGTEEPSETSSKRKYEKMVYEYNRSASSAISEFAPSNNFYVDGRKLKIDQVDLTTAQSAKWRLCPNCSHAQIEESGKNVASCPQCGSVAWADSGQLRSMLKVQMVYSNMDYTKSMISDESDDRSSTFYCKQMLVDVDEDRDISKAYRMDNDEFPFGYEFVKKATLREINFGESDMVGEKLTVSGKEDVRKGFKICKYCGKIQSDTGKPDHTFTCKAKSLQQGMAEPFEECLFLYREFVTEAIRILVPATTMDSSKTRQESFVAAFMLGMKEYFGNVDHLRACLSEVPILDADYGKQYLVIYDSVPGGTGYLKQLMLKENALVEIFERALAVLENCNCKNDPQKDGCYRCLYAYRQSQNIGQISRTTAIRLLQQILRGKENIEEIPKLGNVPVNSLFESELERRFIEALAHMGNDTRNVNITKQLVNNKEGYLLKVGECLWEIEPQVLLDNQQGIAVQSRADFVLRPVRAPEGQKPVVIFTDGFLYHKDKVSDDTLKREAIRRSNNYRVWSLSWKDVQSVFQGQGDYATPTLIPEKMPSGARVYRATVENGNAQSLHPDKVNTFELLIMYLENPNAEQIYTTHAKAFSLSLLDTRNLNNPIAFTEWDYAIRPIIDILTLRDSDFELNDTMFGSWMPRQSNSHLTIYSGISTFEMKRYQLDAIVTVCALLSDDINSRTEKFEAEWNGFWQFFNMMQFLPSFAAVSTEGMNQSIYNAIPTSISTEMSSTIVEEIVDIKWNETFAQLYDDDAKECAKKMMLIGIPAPSIIGFELTDSTGANIAECEMAWEEEKVALLLPEQMDYKNKFEESGWSVLSIRDSFSTNMIQGGRDK